MTFRSGAKYTMNAYITFTPEEREDATLSPFFPMQNRFIDENTISLLARGTNDTPGGMYSNQSAVGFFDSLHDFKTDFIDCETNVRDNADIKKTGKFGFTYLLKGGYPGLLVAQYNNNLIQNKYSYLNRMPRALDQNSLENYFSIGNILNEKTAVYVCGYPLTEAGVSSTSYNAISRFFGSYKDLAFNSKIKLIVDMQVNLFDVIKLAYTNTPSKSDFCILYTAETIADPAPMTKVDNIIEIFGGDNFYTEELANSPRTTLDEKGNVSVSYSNFDKNNLSIDATYECTINLNTYITTNSIKSNVGKRHSNSIDFIKTAIRKEITNITNEIDALEIRNSATDRVQFYNDFNTRIQNNHDDLLKLYTMYYARKRLSDVKQSHACSLIELNKMSFRQHSTNAIIPKNRVIQPAVLVTHDRMLFSYAIINRRPAILNLNTHTLLYDPRRIENRPVDLQLGGGSKNRISSPSKLISKKRLIKGGSNIINNDKELTLNDYKYTLFRDPMAILHLCKLIEDHRTTISQNIGPFLDKVNGMLQNNILSYKYYSQSDSNILLIGPNGSFEGNDNNFKISNGVLDDDELFIADEPNIDRSVLRNSGPRNKEMFYVLYIYINDNEYLKIFCNLTLKIKFSHISGRRPQYEYSENIFNHKIAEYLNDDNQRIEPLYIYDNEFPNLVIGGGYGSPSKTSLSHNNSIIIYNKILKSITSKYKIKNISDFFNISFDKLNKIDNNFFQRNIMTLHVIFDVLTKYEMSFLGYCEGRDSFYHAIDEGLCLPDMPNNFIPNNIEFYVFLQILLDDMTFDKLHTINYSLFEYCLLLHDNYIIYDRIQDIKSYTIHNEIHKLSIEDAHSIEHGKTLKYFEKLCKSTIIESRKINETIFKHINKGQYQKILEIANQNYLSLSGFTSMRRIFAENVVKYIDANENTITLSYPSNVSNSRVKTYLMSSNRKHKQLRSKHVNPRLLNSTIASSHGNTKSNRKLFDRLTGTRKKRTMAQ